MRVAQRTVRAAEFFTKEADGQAAPATRSQMCGSMVTEEGGYLDYPVCRFLRKPGGNSLSAAGFKQLPQPQTHGVILQVPAAPPLYKNQRCKNSWAIATSKPQCNT